MKKTKRLSLFLVVLMVLSLILPAGAFAKSADGLPKGPKQSESTLLQKQVIAEQQAAKTGLPRLHPDLQKLSGSQEVSVIIQLSEDPVAVAEGKKKLKKLPYQASERAKQVHAIKAEQATAKKAMKAKKLLVKEGYSYETVLNGFSATVKADDLDKLLDIPGIRLVEPNAVREALEVPADAGSPDGTADESNSFLEIGRLWDKGLKGQTVKVGVLDTGIDYNHPAFKDNYAGGWNFVPHDQRYARPRADNDPMETTPKDRASGTPEFNSTGSSFYTSHGTHVAGIIAGQANNAYGVAGIAPEVELHAYRVLGGYGSGSTDGIIAAIEKSVEEGMDVINLSLGGGSNTSISADSFAINNAMLKGTIAVIATGNSGPNRGTMGTPATSTLGIAVGNTTQPESHFSADVNMKADGFAKTVHMNLMATEFGTDPDEKLQGEFAVAAIPGFGKETDYAGVDVAGKVALVSRGEIPFVDKIEAAKNHGAAAVLIHNFAGGSNAPGISDVYLGDDFDFIPTFDMSQTDGDAFRAALAGGKGTVTFGAVQETKTAGDEVNSSSSRGPSVPTFDIKPDVSAPGTNIMAAIPAYKSDFPDADYSKAFGRKTGTSMATPQVAGVAALIKQANPDWTPFDVKVALSNTAKLLDVKKYDVFSQGAGRVQPYEAAFPEALAYSYDQTDADGKGTIVDNVKGTVTFGTLTEVKDRDVTVKKTVKVKDVKGNGGDYSVDVRTTKAFGQAAVSVDKSSFKLNGEQELTVTLTAPKAATKAGDELLGYIVISGPGTELSLPFAASFAPTPPTAIESMNITKTDLSFNGDGVNDTADLTFKVTGDLGVNYIELWDLADPDGGAYGDGYIGYLHAGNSLPAGSYRLGIDGQYFPWGEDAPAIIPDGVYTIDMTAQTVSGNPPLVDNSVGPIFVKSTAPEVETSVDGTVVSGRVIDKYLDYKALLAEYGVTVNLNSKLGGFIEVTDAQGDNISFEMVTFNQDGTFSVDLGAAAESGKKAVMTVADAAGNTTESVVFEKEDAPEEPEQPEQPESPVVTVPDQDLNAQLVDKKAKEVTVDVAEFGGNGKLDIALGEDQLDRIIAAKKGITVSAEGLSFTADKKLVERMGAAAGGITIALGKSATDEKSTISDSYSIHFLDKSGNEVNTGKNKDKFDVTLPVDLSGVGKTNKLTVKDSESGNVYKLKVKNGEAAFTADGPGTFTAFN
ncbi:S8 family serine peptidase [Bhargavaea ullalensis]|uniref:Subtilisin family serine protease n=1 Tax=Bhargavaea ullalensis TaxID=1265685 RepID=A0ABV2GAX0_9BACL